MDKKMLDNYLSMVQEKEELDVKVRSLQRQVDKMIDEGSVKDAVKGGEGGIQTFHIEGMPVGEISRKKSLLYMRIMSLQGLCNEIEQQTAEIEQFMSTIEDSKIRRIINYRFLENKTWNEIADVIGGTEDSVRKKFERFFENYNM